MKINAIISLAIPGNLHEHLFVTVGTALICKGAQEKVLGVIIDKNLNLSGVNCEKMVKWIVHVYSPDLLVRIMCLGH